MAKVIVWNIVTLDGYFEGREKWDLSFHELVWGPELEQMSHEIGEAAAMLVFGRVTHDGMKAHWTTTTDEDTKTTNFMNALPKLVASRTITASDWNNTTVTADPVAALTKAKAESEKDIYVFGSADLADTLLKAGVVDEVMVCIAPVLLGAGTKLFNDRPEALKLSLLESRPLQTGGVILRYAPA